MSRTVNYKLVYSEKTKTFYITDGHLNARVNGQIYYKTADSLIDVYTTSKITWEKPYVNFKIDKVLGTFKDNKSFNDAFAEYLI